MNHEKGSPAPAGDLDPGSADRLRLHLATLYHPEVSAALLERAGDAARALALAATLCEATDGDSLELASPRRLRRLLDPSWARRAERELGLSARHGVNIHYRGGPDWPEALEELPSMPTVLFSRGRWDDGDRRAVGIVGTRRPSPYGVRQARRFAEGLAALGITIVSGLARGIDGEAQRAALDAGGRTIAVLGSGLGRIYPPENRDLALRILREDRGLLVTEFPWNAAPLRHHFPQRNRLLSGLSRGILVVEAGARSGSMLTVDWALRQGRSVFVIPGRVDQPQAEGCLKLIQSGAYPVMHPDEFAQAVFPREWPRLERARNGAPAPPEDPGDATVSRLRPLFERDDAWHPDDLCRELGLEPGDLFAELSRLEGEGRVRRIIGGRYTLVR